MDQQYLKLSNHNVFSPVRGYSNGIIKGRKLISRFPKTAKYNSNHSIINDFYSNKNSNVFSNKSNIFFSSNSISLFSPKRNILNYRSIKSSKQKRIKSSSFQKKLPSVINNNNNKSFKSSKQNQFCFETEKLFHETYQIKKVIKELEKELYSLSNENIKKDKQLYQKEKEIDSIINNTHKTFDDDYNEDKKDNNFYDNDINMNTMSTFNSSMGVLILKIKKEIKKTNQEIKNENYKLNYLKKSLYLTKIKELKTESVLLNQQYNKINTLISNALQIKSQNNKTMEEFNHLKDTINKQELILSSLENNCVSLENQEKFLAHQLNVLKNELKIKIIKAKKNNNELNILSIKNKNLNNDKIIKNESFTTKINGVPTTIKCLYTNKLCNLRKNINFYKRQIKFSDDMINKLKEQRKKLVDSHKNFEQKITISPKLIENTNQFKNMKRPQSSIGPPTRITKDEDLINSLRLQYKSFKEDETNLEKKANKYYEKLQEIEMENEERGNNEDQENNDEDNQIEFGIDENNPYYTDNEDNVPESHIKFTSSQFNQFTYILFKNFEAKNIVADEAKNKIIIPFYESIKSKNIIKVPYPSKEYDTIIEEFTKIIMTVLNSDNEYNHALTKIFVGALLYNCDCDTNKLVEYFSILFGYTRNYISEEKHLIEKLKTKYKNQTKKLVECITSYILNDLSSSQYFSLFKMKDLLDKNEINLKDKYIEFLFYYMKKFSDPDAKLEDLKFSLLNDIVPIGDTTIHSKAFIDDLDKDIEFEKNNDNENIKNENQSQKKEKKKIQYDEKKISNMENNKNTDKESNKNIKKDLYKENNKKMNDNTKENKENKEKKESNYNKNIENENKENNKRTHSIENKEETEDKKEELNFNERRTESKIDNENYGDFEKYTNKDIDDNFDIDPKEIKGNENTEEKEADNNININKDNNKKEKNDKGEFDDMEKLINNNDVNEDIKKEDNNNKNNDNIDNNNNNNIINKIINNFEKASEKIKENDEVIISKNSENNKNNEPKLVAEEDKEDKKDNVETGNYSKKEKDKKSDKNESNNTTKSKKNKIKEEEYPQNQNNQNKQTDNNIDDEDQKTLNKNSNNNNNGNGDDTNYNNDEDSVTEITNEEYRKQIIDSINIIQKALKKNSTDFNSLTDDVINKNLINGIFYEYINIEDLNDKFLSIGISLTDLQLSCLCSKYCVPNELRLIDKKKFEKSLEDNLKGTLIIE